MSSSMNKLTGSEASQCPSLLDTTTTTGDDSLIQTPVGAMMNTAAAGESTRKILKNCNNINILTNATAKKGMVGIPPGETVDGEDSQSRNLTIDVGRNVTKASAVAGGESKCLNSGPVPKLSAFRGIHDLTKLDCITLENVLECLRERYRSQQYYTYAGPVLLSLNSCQKVPRASLVEDVARMSWYFYDDENHQKENTNEVHLDRKSPHVYSIGRKGLRNLMTVGSHQIILISGESGAGKTTATQQLIKYLTENNSRTFGANTCSNLDKKIYLATLILEAFGNAKTQANPNSSRFGRLVQLNYKKTTGRITGAEVHTYLLEKHRVAKYDHLYERNFHIFYYVLYGLKTGTLTLTNIPKKDNWKAIKELVPNHFLCHANECESEEVERLLHAIQAFNMADIFTEIVSMLFAMIALLKLSFVPDCDSSSEDDYASGLESPYKTEYTISDSNCAKLAAGLLGVKENELVDLLIARKITAGSSRRHSIFRKPCENSSECEERLHALTSFMYDRIFMYVLDHLNSTMKEDTSQSCGSISDSLSTFSLLDLYGFENFSVNHLEQICINYANERLQQINVSIIKSYYEQSSFLDEEMMPPMELNRIESELAKRIDELHTHIFAFFDEECLLKRSTDDKDVLERLNLASNTSKFIRTGRPHKQILEFTISHYATKVNYQLQGIVQKNKDHIPPEFQDILKTSSNPFISALFEYDLVRSCNASGSLNRPGTFAKNKNARGKTILTRFRTSVEELMSRLKASDNKDIHFIRCIRPNADLVAGTFSMDIVEKQLHACGIADVVKIAGNGYPIRVHLSKFADEFPKLVSYFCNGHLNLTLLSAIFSAPRDKMPLKSGKSMVFMSEKCWMSLKKSEKRVGERSTKIIQLAWRKYLERQDLKRRALSNRCLTLENYSDLESSAQQDVLNNEVSPQDCIGPYGDAGMNVYIASSVQQDSNNPRISLWIKRRNFHEREKPALYYGVGIASRAPIHTRPIKFYTKRTCIPFAEKPPRRLTANGVSDAYDDFGINFFQT